MLQAEGRGCFIVPWYMGDVDQSVDHGRMRGRAERRKGLARRGDRVRYLSNRVGGPQKVITTQVQRVVVEGDYKNATV